MGRETRMAVFVQGGGKRQLGQMAVSPRCQGLTEPDPFVQRWPLS